MIRIDTSKIIDCIVEYLDYFLGGISIILLAPSMDISEESRCRQKLVARNATTGLTSIFSKPPSNQEIFK